MADGHSLFGAQVGLGHEALDEEAVAEIGGNASRGRMGVRQQAELLERGELVAHRRGRDVQPVALDERHGRDRPGRRDVLPDHGAQKVALPRGKLVGQYVNSTLAKQEAKLAGYDEALLLDSNGYVSEGSGENLFVVEGGRLVTPPLSRARPILYRLSALFMSSEVPVTVNAPWT